MFLTGHAHLSCTMVRLKMALNREYSNSQTSMEQVLLYTEQQIYNEGEILPSNLQDQDIQKQRSHFTDRLEHSSDERTLLPTDKDIAGRSTLHSTTFYTTDCRVAC